MSRGRNAQVSRVFSILILLEQNRLGLTVQEIHNHIQRVDPVDENTIRRDLRLIERSGLDLTSTSVMTVEGLKRRWILHRPSSVTQGLLLSPSELLSLYVARGMLEPLRGSPFFGGLERIFAKIEERLGHRSREHLMSLSSEIHFETRGRWGSGVHAEALETLRAACAEGHLVRGHYFSARTGKETPRTLGPHYLYYAKDGLYLVAEDLGDQRVKTFAVPRFRDLEMTDQPYEGQITQPDQKFAASLGTFVGDPEDVVIDFSSEVGAYVRERQWHPSQKTEVLPDGRVRLRLTVASTPDLWDWILSFGPRAVVQGPEALRDRMQELAETTALRYQRKAA